MQATYPDVNVFIQVFKDYKITFVYAFVDDAKSERSIQDDANINPEVSKQNVRDIFNAQRNKKQELRLDPWQALVKAGFFDDKGFISPRFDSIKSLEAFKTDLASFSFTKTLMERSTNEAIKSLYNLLKKHRVAFQSTAAKLAIVHWEKVLNRSHFDFKICQIQRIDEDPADQELGSDISSSSSSSSSSNQPRPAQTPSSSSSSSSSNPPRPAQKPSTSSSSSSSNQPHRNLRDFFKRPDVGQ
jgi:hypothetical protein